jgi:hypothetical protein
LHFGGIQGKGGGVLGVEIESSTETERFVFTGEQ